MAVILRRHAEARGQFHHAFFRNKCRVHIKRDNTVSEGGGCGNKKSNCHCNEVRVNSDKIQASNIPLAA